MLCLKDKLLVPIWILSYMIENTLDFICIANTRHQRWKDNVKNSYLFIAVTIHALYL